MIESLYDKFTGSRGVSTDTRTIKPGDMFFALRGPNHNANEYAGEAIAKGASWVVIDDPNFKESPKFLVVENSLATLQELAISHRGRLKIPFIAVTGSNGKTTTKELIRAVLSTRYKTIATVGNLNNHIGVPLTVLSVNEGTEMAVIEMGANKTGDIAGLCRIANPTHGLITNVSKAHIEGFGSFDAVLRAKTELFDHILRHNGIPFINSGSLVLGPMLQRFKNAVTYPGKNDFSPCELVYADPFIAFRAESGKVISTNLIGAYNFENIAAALCIGKFFRVGEDAAVGAVKNYIPANMRSQIIEKGDNIIILDAYNANPASMEAALKTLSQIEGKTRVAILGDMFELGSIAEAEHGEIGKLTKSYPIEEVIVCGKMMKHAQGANPDARYFTDRASLENFLQSRQFSNSVILIKASRGMQFETLINKIN
jgi:UDP-N-acetylmuramoyl-tripeptide--D-alanyl-D-alanine ligase